MKVSRFSIFSFQMILFIQCISPSCSLAGQLSLGFEKILPPSIASNGWFGGNVSLDGNSLAVTEKRLSNIGGSVDVFELSASGSQFVSTLSPTSTTSRFGSDVSISRGSLNSPSRVIVSSNDGSFVFTESQSGWVDPPIFLQGTENGGELGVAIEGNRALASVGAAEVSLYELSTPTGTSWNQIATLTPSFADQSNLNGGYGRNVRLESGSAIIAANTQDEVIEEDEIITRITNSGAVFAYEGNGSPWQETQAITPADPIFRGNFGADIDVDGDSLIVGRPPGGPSAQGPLQGIAYVYEKSGNQWVNPSLLQSIDGIPGDGFGARVAISGNLAAVSTQNHAEGRVYLFEKTGGLWDELGWLSSGLPFTEDQFGVSLDLDGSTLAIGARLDSEAGTNVGAVYLYQVPEPAGLMLALLAFISCVHQYRFVTHKPFSIS